MSRTRRYLENDHRINMSSADQASQEDEHVHGVEFHLALEQYEEVKARGETPSMGVLKNLLQAYSEKLLSTNETAPDQEEEKRRRSSSLFRLYLILQEMKTIGLAPDAAVYAFRWMRLLLTLNIGTIPLSTRAPEQGILRRH